MSDTKTVMTIKDRIVTRVDEVRQGLNSLRSSDYGDVYFWQEVSALADKKLKDAWKELQAGKVESDDELRDRGEGEHVVNTSKNFCVVAKVTAPRKGFDPEVCRGAIIDAYPQVRTARLEAIFATSLVDGKNPLQKRIVEIVKN